MLSEQYEAKWGHASVTAVGRPSRLNSKGQILSGKPRSRGRRSGRPVSWMDMIKQRIEDRERETRIIGGEPASEASWPWIVSIRLREGAKHFCGGTILADRWVLSAAHCFEQVGAKHIFLTAGHLNKLHSKAKRESGYQANLADVVIRQLKQTIIKNESHDSYHSRTVYADIALIKTSHFWSWTDHVKPACLPDRSFYPDDGAVCAIAGWGSTDGNRKVLNQATIPKFNWRRCQNLLEGAMIDKTQSCWGKMEGGVDTCQGDSGGPLVCVSSGAWVVTGITSWGFGCGDSHSPGIYTDVAKYNPWINYHLSN